MYIVCHFPKQCMSLQSFFGDGLYVRDTWMWRNLGNTQNQNPRSVFFAFFGEIPDRSLRDTSYHIPISPFRPSFSSEKRRVLGTILEINQNFWKHSDCLQSMFLSFRKLNGLIGFAPKDDFRHWDDYGKCLGCTRRFWLSCARGLCLGCARGPVRYHPHPTPPFCLKYPQVCLAPDDLYVIIPTPPHPTPPFGLIYTQVCLAPDLYVIIPTPPHPTPPL